MLYSKTKTITSFCLFYFLTSLKSVAESNTSNAFLKLESHTYSEPTSISSFINEFSGTVSEGDYAYTKSQIELGFTYQPFLISYIFRYDYFFEFSNDTAQFYHDILNSKQQPRLQQYQLQLKTNHIRAKGIKLGYNKQVLDRLTLYGAVSYLVADEFLDSYFTGQASLLNNGRYGSDIVLESISDHDVILEFPMNSPTGKGYAVDVGFTYQVNEQWEIDFKALDIISEIHWKNVLDSQFEITTATRQFDENGKLKVSPVLVGVQFLVDYKQKLPQKIATEISYTHANRQRLFAQMYHTEYFTHKLLGYEIPLFDDKKIAFSWGMDTKSVGINIQGRLLSMGLHTDNFNYNKSKFLNLTLGFNFSF